MENDTFRSFTFIWKEGFDGHRPEFLSVLRLCFRDVTVFVKVRNAMDNVHFLHSSQPLLVQIQQ